MATKKKRNELNEADDQRGSVIAMKPKGTNGHAVETDKGKKVDKPAAAPEPEKPAVGGVIIRMAKIVSDLFLSVQFDEDLPGHARKETTLSCTVPVHEDLKYQFDKLHKHLAILCDEVKAPKADAFPGVSFPDFNVRGFSLIGADAKEGVTIRGYKEGKYGGVTLATPRTKYADSSYPFLSELSLDIDACVYEVEQYLFHGKRAPEKQIEMDFGEAEAGPAEDKEGLSEDFLAQ